MAFWVVVFSQNYSLSNGIPLSFWRGVRGEALNKLNHILLGNVLTIHADALAEIHEVGRGVEADAQAGILQNPRQRVRNRAFPVGSGHMDCLVFAVRMAVVGIEHLAGL